MSTQPRDEQYRTETTFDAVAWMRRRRAEIDEEDEGLTWQGKRRKPHEILLRDPILAAMCSQRKYPLEMCAAREPCRRNDN